jgi:RND superfamily putative drug exporter
VAPPPAGAIERAARHVGESITFSAGTVIVALLALLLASFGLYSGLGPALAIGIALMLLAALTLLPALLGVFGRAVFWPREVKGPAAEGIWIRVAERVVAHPAATLVAGVVVFGALAVAATGYQSSGFGGSSTGPPGSDSAEGTQALNAHYPAGVANPTVVLLGFPSSVWNNLGPVQQAEQQLSNESVFSSVNGMFDPNGTALSAQTLSSLYAQLGPPGKLPATPTTSAVSQQQYQLYRSTAQFVSPDGRTVQFSTSPRAGDPGLDFVLPFLLFVFLMALGEDYNILVMSRIREEAWHARLREAVAAAVHATGTPVTSAGMILAATFGVAGLTGPNDQVKELGSAIALGVLLDTFLVRTLLVPSTVVLLGRFNWWPSKLARRPAPARIPRAASGAANVGDRGSRRHR